MPTFHTSSDPTPWTSYCSISLVSFIETLLKGAVSTLSFNFLKSHFFPLNPLCHPLVPTPLLRLLVKVTTLLNPVHLSWDPHGVGVGFPCYPPTKSTRLSLHVPLAGWVVQELCRSAILMAEL